MTPALLMEGVRYRYPETTKYVLDGIDLTVAHGEWLGVIGPTNAGKSTLCYAAIGLATEFFNGTLRGRISVLGKEISKERVVERSRHVGMLFQNPFTQISGARERVDEEVAFGPENHGLPADVVAQRVDEALEQVGLEGLRDRHPLDLSGGQLQRLALGSLLAMHPELLLLDEPTSQLDPAGTEELFAVLRALHSRGVTIVMVEQKLEAIAELCDHVIALVQGKVLASGPPNTVFNDSAVQEAAGAPIYASLARRAALPAPWPVTFDSALAAFRA